MFDPKAVAIVGLGAIMPDAENADSFWKNVLGNHYSISDVPADRWNVDLYYDPDPAAVDKTYSKIGGWVHSFTFEPLKWGIPIPPSVLAVMDDGQKWGIATARQALLDYGYPQKPLDQTRVAVILGNALAGENHYITSLRIHLPDFLTSLASVDAFRQLPHEVQAALVEGVQQDFRARIANITEDTMPGELGNIIAGRIANVFNFAGPNFVTDAACASSLAALQAAVDGLVSHQFDAVLTGGVDRNMGIEGFVKFSKIGALSPDGSRPFAEGANGFVMGEGAALFLLKRLADAERDGDKIYAVIRGIGSSSDGKGKGITAPNPLGQQRALERAWKNAGVNPASVGLIEAHGTSTKVGDVVEVNSLNAIFGQFSLPPRQIALGSVKSNIGHLKSAAGAAGMLKATLALHTKTLPPSANFHKPNPDIDFGHIPFYVNTEARPWENLPGEIRRAGVSSFGFGGTNFHVVMEEWVPGLLTSEQKIFPGFEIKAAAQPEAEPERTLTVETAERMATYRGVMFLAAPSKNELKSRLAAALEDARSGKTPPQVAPDPADLRQPERIAIDFGDAAELVKRAEKALSAFEDEFPNTWQALTAQGIYRGSGEPGKLAFLFPGQGSQYVNMLKDLCEVEAVVADTFKEADQVMTPILGRPLTSYIYVEGDEESLKKAEAALRDTAITQPAMLTANVALLRLMNQFGYTPDLVIGHSLGEYAALVASGVLTFAEALEVVSARGREMKKVSMEDNGCMAAVSAPIEQVEKILSQVDGYVVLANINSPLQSVVGGNTQAVEAALRAFDQAGFQATKIPVSHAFHTRIVAPASEPLKSVIDRMSLQPPKIPVVANVTGELYPSSREEILEILARQVASPVQFIKGIQTLYSQGARVFVEVGPKRVLNALATDNFKDKNDVILLATNHPRKGAVVSFNEALCGLFAAGVLYSTHAGQSAGQTAQARSAELKQTVISEPANHPAPTGQPQAAAPAGDGRLPLTGSVVISGAGLGLPGRTGAVFADHNVESILKGEIRIEPLPEDSRLAMVEKRVTRLEKSDAGAQMVNIDNLDLTIKLAGQRGSFDLIQDFGVPEERADACDVSTQLAIASGIEALRDAGIPLVMAYRQTSKGTYLPDRWRLPEALRDETGVIFASAFPGVNRMAEEADRFYQHRQLQSQLEEIRQISALVFEDQADLRKALAARMDELQARLNQMDYHFDRRFIFRILAMGHSQFAEYIGARGPNTHVNAACATTTHAIAIAEDWIRAGRCRRVVIIAGDDVTNPTTAAWIGTGLLASGATTIEQDLRLAALPFDRRRNGMIMGMGAAALVVESEDAVRERGMKGICEILATEIANSAFHGTRLDVPHVREVMDRLVTRAEQRFGIRRGEIASQTMFMSHETYTPARGGSASAEIHALRHTFGDAASQVIIANTKGYTGHTMGVGVEDVVSVKALENGIVPPIANYDEKFEPDPELGDLNLSRGGEYPIRYALRLGAGFGSQIAMALFRVIPGVKERVLQDRYKEWLARAAGYEQAELEVVQRTLRIRHAGPPVKEPVKSTWQFGQGPTLWADRQDEAVRRSVEQPAPDFTPGEAQNPAPNHHPITAQPPAALEEIKAFVLQQVAEKTGYPAEMLDLDLDLEADLGIDTVKQAELFAAIREHYQIPRREDLRLVDYNTLAKVIQFMHEALSVGSASPAEAQQAEPAAAQPGQAEPAPAAVAMNDLERESVRQYVLSVVSEKTGYPAEMLDMDLDLEADLGIDTVKQAELFATVRTHYGIPRREDLRLVDYNTLSKVVQFILDSSSQTAPNATEIAPSPAPVAAEALSTPMPVKASIDSTRTPVPDMEGLPYGAMAGQNSNEIAAFVTDLVSQKTGYPAEMLDMDLDLEADLGIDTVKQAELFAAVRTHYGIPRREDLRLVDYNTLSKVVGFVQDSLKNQAAAAPPSVSIESGIAQSTAAPAAETDEGQAVAAERGKEAPAAIRRRVPAPVLRPRLDLCVPTGVKLEEGVKVLVVADKGKVADSLARRLRGRNVQVLLTPPQPIENLIENLKIWQEPGPIHGIFYLPALDPEPDLDTHTPESWQQLLAERVTPLYHLMREIRPEPFLVCATRLGGLHGYDGQKPPAPSGGAVSGFAKALQMERAETFVKVVDFSEDETPAQVAIRLIDETLSDPGAVEIGWKGEQRFTVAMIERETADEPFVLGEKPVFLVTGGSAGISAPVVIDLAQRTQGRFYLLSRTPLPAADNPDLTRLRTDRDGLKREWMLQMAQNGNKPTPAQIERRLSALERTAATLDAIRVVEQAGGTARYLVCDVTDPDQVDKAVKAVADDEGSLAVILHVAGFEHSRRLESKPLEEFEGTITVKVNGFFNVYQALRRHKLQPKAWVMFTSVAGRFGNAGQTDYSAANDWLCKLSAALNSPSSGTKAVAIDWGAWAEVGMSARGYIPELMKRAGIDLIAPSEAAPWVYRELIRGHSGSEVILAGSLGRLETMGREDGGLNIDAANRALTEGEPIHIMLSRLTGLRLHEGILLEAELDPSSEPFLRDHTLNGVPLLPGVMGIEGFTIAAKHIASSIGASKRGFDVTQLEDIQFLTPFKFYRNEKRRITWKAQVVYEKSGLVAYVTLESRLAARTRKDEIVQHFAGKVHLKPLDVPLQEVKIKPPEWNGAYTVEAADIYRLYFHGPSFQVLEGVQRSGNVVLGKLSSSLPSITRNGKEDPTTPVLVELCMQTAGVWEAGSTGILALPRSIGELTLYKARPNGAPIFAEVTPGTDDDGRICFDARVVDAKGQVYLEMRDYRTSPLPYTVEEKLLEPLKELVKAR